MFNNSPVDMEQQQCQPKFNALHEPLMMKASLLTERTLLWERSLFWGIRLIIHVRDLPRKPKFLTYRLPEQPSIVPLVRKPSKKIGSQVALFWSYLCILVTMDRRLAVYSPTLHGRHRSNSVAWRLSFAWHVRCRRVERSSAYLAGPRP